MSKIKEMWEKMVNSKKLERIIMGQQKEKRSLYRPKAVGIPETTTTTPAPTTTTLALEITTPTTTQGQPVNNDVNETKDNKDVVEEREESKEQQVLTEVMTEPETKPVITSSTNYKDHRWQLLPDQRVSAALFFIVNIAH